MTAGLKLPSPLRAALAECRHHFIAAGLFSAFSNLLYLAPSLFMLQVYDRVVPTGGLATLAALGLIAALALVALGLFEWLRSSLLIRASAQLEARLAGRTLEQAMQRPDLSRLERAEMMRDFDTLRQGIASPGVVAAFDAPWVPIYVIAAFLLHPTLGIMTLLAGMLLVGLAWANERATAKPMKLAGEAASIAYARQNHSVAHAAEVRALGMVRALTQIQLHDRDRSNSLQMRASFTANSYGGVIKFLRLALQSAVLALGAVLVVEHAISAGSMIAASLLMARALAPVEQFVAAWKSIAQTRLAYGRLNTLFGSAPAGELTRLEPPTGAIEVERVTVLAPGTERVALAEASFAIQPGEIIGIVGSSGAGKSTLLKVMAGAAVPARGHVRFDGGSRADWDSERLAAFVGYLPQDFILFPGSIKDNITRFGQATGGDPATLDSAAIAAAKAVDAHDMILRLPQGYNTQIGAGGIGLSAGQTQRIALARALFGDPRVLLLDEPTAHLDGEAQQAFAATLVNLRQRGVTVLFASHNVETLASADKLLIMAHGRVQHMAPNSELRPTDLAPPPQPQSFRTRKVFQ